jgi:genome maintenance exonuclease 1
MGLGFRDGFKPTSNRAEFIHMPWDYSTELESKTENGQRFYQTPEGNKYPSVSTVVGHFSKKGIMEWRARVGNEEANRISKQASTHGTAVHSICEDYVNNEEDFYKKKSPANIEAFKKIKPVLDDNIDLVYAQEASLYSDFLKVAGRCDLACKWNGLDTIVDFKTSRKEKKEEWIQNYFQQAAMYAVMAEERTGKPFSQIAIVIACEDSNVPQLFTKKRDDYIHTAIDLIKQFYKEVLQQS